tara:strand:+ start:24553 stop:25404 length:852 start_codon:yes stop_codon:yes gene_type:complete
MWLAKIIIKMILSRIPISYGIWKKFKIFRHGQMENFDYSKSIFEGHFKDLNKFNAITNPSILEIGPGDSLFSMIFSRMYSTNKFYFLDVGDFANKDVRLYRDLIKKLKSQGFLENFCIKEDFSFDELISYSNATYLTLGLTDFRKLKDESIDYIFSHSVIEHVRLYELDELIFHMYRVIKPGGLISHNINYKDHLSESLNNLRFSEKIWESDFFANSGFYTNRVPAIKMHSLFRNVGFKIISENFGSWSKLPIPRSKISNDFREFSNKDLSNCTSSFIAQKDF